MPALHGCILLALKPIVPATMHRLAHIAAALLLSSSLLSSGRASAAGTFEQSQSLQGVTFRVKASGAGSQQQLTITARDGKRAFQPIHETVDGQVIGAEVADLNSDSQPEIYVYVQGAGSGSYGQLVAYSASRGQNLLPIYLQELSGAPAKGYRGHDAFSVVEGCLVRRFPIDRPTDSNAKATGGLRQICYKLRNGEASWILRPTSVLQF